MDLKLISEHIKTFQVLKTTLKGETFGKTIQNAEKKINST